MKRAPFSPRSFSLALLFLAATVAVPPAAPAQTASVRQRTVKTFTDIKVLPSTSVKNQASTSTCWDFSALSLMESELIRTRKGEYDLSEMYVVDHVYREKADAYYRMHGNNTFGPGGLGHDVMNAIAQWGIVRESDFSGMWPYETRHNHNELQNVLKADLDAVLRTRPGPSPKWSKGFGAILDAYLGPLPESIEVDGGSVTPKQFADQLGLDPSAYVEITSFTNMPFWRQVALETPDNWAHYDRSWNLPLDDVMHVLRHAIENGYTVEIGADVSEPEFKQDSGYATWKEGETVTPDDRQVGWDRWTTTDDHGMHVVGIAKDENGKTFYLVKNSWGDVGPYHGYIYMSENYIRAKFDLLMLHRDGIPAEIRARMMPD